MATAINSGNAARGADESYFFRMACAMAAVMVAGFSLQLAMGRSSFGAPLRVHAHAVIFFGWIVLFLTQARLASRGNFALHRRLGQLAALWMAAMVAAGLIVTVALVQEGRAPFFFYPQQFLIADPDAARVDADQGGAGSIDMRPHRLRERGAEGFGVRQLRSGHARHSSLGE